MIKHKISIFLSDYNFISMKLPEVFGAALCFFVIKTSVEMLISFQVYIK